MPKEFSNVQLAVFVLMPQAIENFENTMLTQKEDITEIKIIKDMKNPRNALYRYLGVAAVGMITLARSNRSYKTCTGAALVIVGLGFAALSAKRLHDASLIFRDLILETPMSEDDST